jgi:outer membrane protein assembly factor BamB
MTETIIITPCERSDSELVYAERAQRARSLHVLMQDASSRADGARASFLAAAYRDAIARYQSSARIERALSYLRRTARALDELSVQVETRVDDFRGLGIYVLVEEADAFYLLCPREAPARVRVNGAFVPLLGSAGPGPHGAEEVAVETARAQHDLFAQTLPDTLVLIRVPRPRGGELEWLIGGAPQELAAALDALDARRGASATLTSDRITRTLVCLRFDGASAARNADEAIAARDGGRSWRRGAVAASLVIATAIGVGVVASRVDFERATVEPDPSAEHAARATQDRPTPVMTRETSVDERPLEVATVSDTAPEESKTPRFALAWEKSYSQPVTSSPSVVGDGVVFGARDGKVYAVDRDSGEAKWSHTAVGGVGASPVVRGDAVLVADYGGNVYRLARGDGRVAWKRALREKIVSTPASTGERLAVGTSRGNVYALSLETGRVLWKFATRGQVRGGIAHAGDSFLVPSHDGRLYALADDTGRKRWSVALGGPIGSTPDTDGTRVVVGTASGAIVAVALADGKRQWSFATRAAVNSAILVHDGRVYAGSADEHVYCLDAATGELVWRFETSGTVFSRPFVADDRVVVTSYDGSVYALNIADGTLVDRYSTDKSIYSSPIVVGDRVYFGNNAGRFFCLNLRDS